MLVVSGQYLPGSDIDSTVPSLLHLLLLLLLLSSAPLLSPVTPYLTLGFHLPFYFFHTTPGQAQLTAAQAAHTLWTVHHSPPLLLFLDTLTASFFCRRTLVANCRPLHIRKTTVTCERLQ